MCGIAGYLGSRQLPPENLRRCLALMQRRGPDDAAVREWTVGREQRLYLLHSRLSIIDLDPRANQPFRIGSKWMVYNGELYNYLELRQDLIARGYPFTTTSDTEVLLRVLDAFGEDGLDRCEGMWAFAIYDEADGTLTLCRDRFGEKPLCLYRDASGLYFGSEAKCLAALLGRPLEVNLRQLYRYLVNGYKALYKSGETFFQDVRELQPGTLLRVEPSGRETVQTYWRPAFTPDEAMTYEEAVAGARERIIRAVEIRLRADVPLAFCMSGGVDSNALISIAKRVLGYDVHGFTIVNADARYDEWELVEHAVRALGIRHTAVPVDPNGFLPKLRELVRYHDAPVSTITYYAHWLLMDHIAQHGYRISVSGTAADEFFTGYYDHHLAYLYQIRHDPARYAQATEAWRRAIQPLVRNPFLRDPELFIKQPGFRDHLFLDAPAFARCLRDEWSEPFVEHQFTDDLLRNRMLNELCDETVPVILHEDDLNAMSMSIENRSPYLDRPLCEWCFRIPTRHLIRQGLAKAVLRDAMRGIVPDQILNSPRKVGFNAPIFSFLDVHDPAVRNALLEESLIFSHVRRDAIEALLNKPDLPNSQSKFLFSFLSSKMFLEEFARASDEVLQPVHSA